jgi:hypothetical protein
MIPVARFLCTGQAREWVEIQTEDQTWEQFKTAFLREYGAKNQDQLRMEIVTVGRVSAARLLGICENHG